MEVQDGLQIGQLVRITAGPLKGMEGHLVRIKNKDRFAIHVHMLGQTILAEIAYRDLKTC